MPTDQNPKQIIAQRLKDATNILVTVSHDPSVDELSAALGMTLVLEKMDKAATAVFSGQIPPAIEFLEPGKTFDTNVDGLRDFIIALDKSKADRLRYKVEDDVVRVFITPYKTTITEDDLTFSQGDFNVDLIVAFGVEKREDLDTAITAHGRILHDASVVTINQLPGGSTLGEVDWNDQDASSLCEMLMSLTESLQSGLLDESIASALLTGLVSSTDRFRNAKTSPKVMTMAAQLMAAGANQQLIAEKLEEANTVSSGKLNGGDEAGEAVAAKPKSNDGEMKVDHEEVVVAPAPPVQPQLDPVAVKADEVAAADSADAVEEANDELAHIVDNPLPPVVPTGPQISRSKMSSWRDTPAQAPSTGGSLSATSEQAIEDKLRAEEDDKNHVLLSHDRPSEGVAPPALNASTLPSTEPTVQDIFSVAPVAVPITPPAQPAEVVAPVPVSDPGKLVFEETPVASSTRENPTLADLEAEMRRQEQPLPEASSIDTARAAVDAALGSLPFSPAGQPLAAVGAQPFGDISHTPPAPASSPAAIAPPAPGLAVLPPLPDFSTLPPLPGETTPVMPQNTPSVPAMPSFGLPEQTIPAEPTANTMFPVAGNDPAQFKLPGQV